MNHTDLLTSRNNVYTQWGEDGILAAIFDMIGAGSRWCCEFGAWDGVHFSNTRRLIEQGWSAVLIEADEERFRELLANSEAFPAVHCFNRLVDAQGLEECLRSAGAARLDLLVVDIDGLDYDVIERFSGHPRVLSVEVNAGHDPRSVTPVPRAVAAENVGQPFARFHELLTGRGYQLAVFTGNAIYVEQTPDLPALTPVEAYERFLADLDLDAREWLYRVNRAEVPPFHRFENPYLTRERLGLSRIRLASRSARTKAIGAASRLRGG